ncbi:catechol 1,2-dioxygenase [Quadrisphaera granulorum]|uniref:Catechol 1,2-dioxygenase n=1 Tax=Quadrisphaera granulorum TaxID=317664 RepID=A0A316A8W5_9ACTN|nr:catechol 1,2-dioxygenase [Quadrisphaera granulorum]PWJ54141.1 catechol 1,2-dioxygenase [Quadrisphaera granulorum]SZE96280.1 catechol 1,2-dioxygenase [Quadrisphaera granulorum]
MSTLDRTDELVTPLTATAAASGAQASASFRTNEVYSGATADVSTERVHTVARAVLKAVHAVIEEHEVSYPEFQAAKKWLMDVGEFGEWPLFLDVFVEHAVEEVASKAQHGTKGTILGPYYLPGQAQLASPATLPSRAEEVGTPLLFTGRVTDLDGNPLAGATLDIWHADSDGLYSGFAPGIPDGNLRGVVSTDADGRFEIHTIEPAPYQIPTDGPTGALIRAAGWSAWRPAHLHLLVGAPGHRTVTTQLYFAGGEHLENDVAEATKPELVLNPVQTPSGERVAEYDFVLERA